MEAFTPIISPLIFCSHARIIAGQDWKERETERDKVKEREGERVKERESERERNGEHWHLQYEISAFLIFKPFTLGFSLGFFGK